MEKIDWNISEREALAIQEKLAGKVITENRLNKVRTVAGIDMGFFGDHGRAAIAVLTFPELELCEQAVFEGPVTFPYIPGLFSFREGPMAMEALNRLSAPPDLLIFDGQGTAHPRRIGIASHIGILTGIPSVGCAKTRLCGEHEEPDSLRGSYSLLKENNETIGAVVRTQNNVKPVYVSPGHLVDLETSVEYVLACCIRYRLPETTRMAHRIAENKR